MKRRKPVVTRIVPADPRLQLYAALTHLLDEAFTLPGTKWRFGVESVLGLIPGLGDLLGSVAGLYGVWLARQLGAPLAVQGRMMLNLGIDTIVGAVPLLGDLFDFAFKAQVRNHALLTRWLEEPHQTQRTSWIVLAIGTVALLAFTGGAVWLAVRAISWLFGALSA